MSYGIEKGIGRALLSSIDVFFVFLKASFFELRIKIFCFFILLFALCS